MPPPVRREALVRWLAVLGATFLARGFVIGLLARMVG
jgi:hypothetical protein